MRQRPGLGRRLLWLLGIVVCLGHQPLFAQWTTQTIRLQPGWNAVHLTVQPGPDDCDAVLAGLPVESVWAWNPRLSTVQFIQDPNELLPGQPNWLTHLPADHPARAARNLFHLRGGGAYLVKLKAGASATDLNLRGRPVLRAIDWRADSFNLVGFAVAPGDAATFAGLFSGSPAHAGKPVYRMNDSGQWELIANPAATAVQAGKAYWVYCQGSSSFTGPLQLELEQRAGLDFGRILTEQTLRIRNTSASITTVTVRGIPSSAPPPGTPLLAGQVPLAYHRIDTAQNQFGWVPLPESLQRTAIAPGQEWVLRLGPRRTAMANFTPPPAHPGVLYQSLLEITGSAGIRLLVPVSAEGLTSHPATGAAAASLALQGSARSARPAASHPRAGLWVGTAAIAKVNQPASIPAPDSPVATASPFQFRLILHVDNAGKVQLLQKVLQLFKPGTLKPDSGDPTRNVVDQPGRLVLVTDDALVGRFSGATLRDGQGVARRISSPAFAFSKPVPWTGPGDFGAGRLNCEIPLDYDDPLNPFKHRYHPEHDNQNDRFEARVPEGIESFTVTRRIEIEFTADDPDGLAIAGWGDNQLGGIYRESITGLHSKTIYAAGTFASPRRRASGC